AEIEFISKDKRSANSRLPHPREIAAARWTSLHPTSWVVRAVVKRKRGLKTITKKTPAGIRELSGNSGLLEPQPSVLEAGYTHGVRLALKLTVRFVQTGKRLQQVYSIALREIGNGFIVVEFSKTIVRVFRDQIFDLAVPSLQPRFNHLVMEQKACSY